MNRTNEDYITITQIGYRLSDEGVVTNPAGKVICNSSHPDRYRYVDIRLEKRKSNRVYIHKWMAFKKFKIKNISKGRVVIHLDGNLSNNSIDNIDLKTRATYYKKLKAKAL